jgi:hypothetical protein
MIKWSERIGRAAMLGFAWAGAWLPFGIVGGSILAGEVEPEHIGGPLFAGVACGAVFAALSGFAAGRRLDEISFSRATARGAAAGLLLGLSLFAVGDYHRGSTPLTAWQFWLVACGSMTVICAVTAPISVWLARLSKAETTRTAAQGSRLTPP